MAGPSRAPTGRQEALQDPERSLTIGSPVPRGCGTTSWDEGARTSGGGKTVYRPWLQNEAERSKTTLRTKAHLSTGSSSYTKGGGQ